MKRLITALAVVALLIAPASAKIGEAELSGSYVDTENSGEIASVTGGVYAPMFGRFLIGPAGKFSYLDVPGAGSRTGYAGGVVVEWHVLDNEQGLMPFVRAEGFKWLGDLEDTYDFEYGVGGGIKIGDDATAFKFTVLRTWIDGTDEQHTTASVGFVWRL